MSRGLARRLSRIEAASAPASRALGYVLHLKAGETGRQAIARLYPNVGIPKGHLWLVVPQRVGDAGRAAWEAALKASQMALVADADREISELRRFEQETGETLVGPIAAAYARHRVAAKSNPYRKDH